jgi:hypothetical protein
MPKDIRPIRIEGNIAFVPLTKGHEAVIDAADVPLVSGHNWRALVRRDTIYAQTTDRSGGCRRDILMHRAIMGEPDGVHIDHEDGNGLHNQRLNLRSATRSQNMQNARTRRDNSSGYKGVSLHKRSGLWRAEIQSNGHRKTIGYYEAPEAAHAAYCEASAKYHGEFGRTA